MQRLQKNEPLGADARASNGADPVRWDAALREMFDCMAQGVLFQDRNSIVLRANPAAERILGIPRDELIGRSSHIDFLEISDENGERLNEGNMPSTVALNSGRPVRSSLIGIVSPLTRERRWLRLDAFPHFQAPGAENIVCMIFADVTEFRKNLSDLHESQSHLALAQRVASMGSALLDFETGVCKWSRETYAILGIEENSLAPTLDAILVHIHPDDRRACAEAIDRACRDDVPGPIDCRIVRPDEQIRNLHLEMETIRSQAGAATGLIVTMQDATEFREAQRQRESLRTQLYHAQRVESLGVLAGGIAHDLNNTLVPVLALSESMLKSPAIGEAQRPLVDLIHKGGVRARDLVRQILSFSRRENPNSQLIALAPFVRESLQLARAGIPTTIRIEEAIADVPPIMGDRSQLHQVMLNLIANAAHAIGEQQGIVTVELSADVAHGLDGEKENRNNCVRISVSDTGKGMDEKTQERIFEPFFTTKRVGEGSGLGLAVVHGIVAAHRGRIVVSSKVGTGSRFDVLLPLVDGNDGQGVP